MPRFSFYLFIVFTILIIGCFKPALPDQRYSQFTFEKKAQSVNDSTIITLTNPIAAPIKVRLSNNDTLLKSLIVNGFEETILSYHESELSLIEAEELKYRITIGDPEKAAYDSTKYTFPFPKGKTYKILQGYNGSYSHNGPFSRYAIDFYLEIGDTVTAARDGIVVGVIEDYDVGYGSKEYRPFANFITLYHKDGTLSQYTHLKYKGALVELGDTVSALQPIGLSGNTGFSAGPHLHFNTLVPTNDGAKGFKINFENISGEQLKRGDRVSH
jgi:murein DD-endopeptidase MepM/ murein hydrolase activator NlpD